MRWWAFWRRVQYGTGFLVFFSLCAGVLYYQYGYEAPTCFDTVQNADERGVDCGGSCVRICALDVVPPHVLWAESFKIIEGQYNAVAYIENRNEAAGVPKLGYSFKLYDDAGLITERSGETVLPPDSEYPIFEGRIMTGDRVPTKTVLELTSGDTVWLPGASGRDQFSLEQRELTGADSRPRLTASVRNKYLDEALDVEVVATIFNTQGKPLTAARTVIDIFPPRTTKDIVFTWPEPIAKTLRSCETPTDVLLAVDLSGSMNNDGGTPPEPITSVLEAAQSFVGNLQNKDAVGLVTYATDAKLGKTLTTAREEVRSAITGLVIDPKEERGSTNIGAALIQSADELNSSRHNADARKVAILLTDGLATAPDPDPNAFARTAAERLKSTDIQLFTIGLGTEVNEALLRELATTPGQYYNAPSVRELDTIYAAISKDICEDGPAVIEVIPKTETVFEPLQ